jgi:hypothetical protein
MHGADARSGRYSFAPHDRHKVIFWALEVDMLSHERIPIKPAATVFPTTSGKSNQ